MYNLTAEIEKAVYEMKVPFVWTSDFIAEKYTPLDGNIISAIQRYCSMLLKMIRAGDWKSFFDSREAPDMSPVGISIISSPLSMPVTALYALEKVNTREIQS
jgi:hypothetical protein